MSFFARTDQKKIFIPLLIVLFFLLLLSAYLYLKANGRKLGFESSNIIPEPTNFTLAEVGSDLKPGFSQATTQSLLYVAELEDVFSESNSIFLELSGKLSGGRNIKIKMKYISFEGEYPLQRRYSKALYPTTRDFEMKSLNHEEASSYLRDHIREIVVVSLPLEKENISVTSNSDEILACNRSFANLMEGEVSKIDCEPYISQVMVYE